MKILNLFVALFLLATISNAQESEEILPELVNEDVLGFKTVDYVSLTAVLIEAVKELNEKVENLENENTSLKAELTKTESQGKKLDDLQKQINSLQQLFGQLNQTPEEKKQFLTSEQ